MTDSVSEKSDVLITSEARPRKDFGVDASPFNGIKLELGICLILGVLLWLGANSITADAGAQLLMLLAYSVAGAAWLMLRTRAVLHRCEAEHSAE